MLVWVLPLCPPSLLLLIGHLHLSSVWLPLFLRSCGYGGPEVFYFSIGRTKSILQYARVPLLKPPGKTKRAGYCSPVVAFMAQINKRMPQKSVCFVGPTPGSTCSYSKHGIFNLDISSPSAESCFSSHLFYFGNFQWALSILNAPSLSTRRTYLCLLPLFTWLPCSPTLLPNSRTRSAKVGL